MNRTNQPPAPTGGVLRLEQAEARAEQAETRTEQAKTRTEMAESRTERAESRTELAETRTEIAKSRAEQAEIRTEQVEAVLQHVIHPDAGLPQAISTPLLNAPPSTQIAGQKSSLDLLTARQREIVHLIAQGCNTKQIAETLKLSPKTVEYHRLKLMGRLDVHDVAGLVRFALRVGLVPPEP